ncbi:MAG: DUF3488 and transglutaminase-like domain-containing protein [Cycloclasticus sp.]|nr:DUF3488 and transglutaminase-like domain-containing protein [Cycloclasticus sp.]
MPEPRLNPSVIKLLLLIATLLVLPHIGSLQVIFIAVSLLLITWCAIAHYFKRFFPNKWLLLALSLLLAFLVLRLHGMSLGREASSSFLLVLLGLKLLECRANRDVLAVIFVSFFVLITPFLFDQTIGLALYSLCLFFLLLSALVVNNTNLNNLGALFPYRFAGVIMLLALPLMLLSFLLFPRMIGPLWAMPSDASNAISGISDSINPGQISHLALSKETAFRARFNDRSPAHHQLYWRGPVFWNTDGRQWTLSPSKTIKQYAISGPVSTTFQYSIVMEPHQQVWLYALDSPIKAPGDVKITEDRQLISNKKLSRSRAFDFTSSIQPTSETISKEDKSRALALPDNTDIRILQLASSWRNDTRSDMGVINNGLAFFNKENFYYTLTPPQLGNDPVADFLFDSKRGFCGHYATSFAVVLRAAGIPSRLVAGYQGGLYNSVGNFWEVRQADAHVWVEAWVQSLGWVRIDPTAAISPNRIQHAIDLDEQRIGDEIKFFIKPPDGLARWGQQLNSILQTVDYYWESGVLAYGPEVQNDFLANFGLHGWEDMVLWLAVLSGAFLLIFSVYLYRLKPNKIDPAQKAYLSFCKILARRYGEKRPSDTSLAYFSRISESQPSFRERLLQVRVHYLHCRYGGGRIEPLLASIKYFKL